MLASVAGRIIAAASFAALFLGSTCFVYGQDQLKTALDIKPKHEVDYEQPDDAVLKDCKVSKTTKPSGFVVHHNSGRILRQFVDTNGDGPLDQWSYFKDGKEVYRDIDSNFDRKTDQYRWVGEGGTRWGLDNNQDGVIDSWKVISAEEVALECFEAIKNRDAKRFQRLLLTPTEFEGLQLGSSMAKDVQDRLKQASSGFLSMAGAQKAIGSSSKWVYAGNGQPAMMPAGSLGNQQDLIAYNHASGFFESDEIRQLALGSLVKVGETWRMIELPEIANPEKPLTNGDAFFPMPNFGGSEIAATGNDQKLADLYERLAELETQLKSATGTALEKLEKEKADVLVQFYVNTTEPKSKQNWLENLADSVSSSYQTERFEGGLDYLEKFIASQKSASGMDYVKWRSIFARYGWTNANGNKLQQEAGYERLIEDLKDFQKQFPESPFAGDAVTQLAVHYEVKFTDEPDKALEWYKICQSKYGDTKYGRRAKGAITRLSGMGKPVEFSGQTLDGKNFDLQRDGRGRIVVLHFWETWCDDGLDELAKLAEKFKNEVVFVSCNIEDDTSTFQAYLKQNPGKISWIQLHAPGTVDDSPLAHQLGVATEPMVILVDKKGNLVESNIGISGLEREIERERRRK
jgi:thiol-disulfide isomerase/thioredoxin